LLLQIYRQLAGGVGIPYTRWHGSQSGYHILVMDLLGPSLRDLFVFCDRKFTLKTILMLADQMVNLSLFLLSFYYSVSNLLTRQITRIEYIHSHGLIHRDLKPSNFLLGLRKQGHQINVIDFGLAEPYRDPWTGQHLASCEKKSHAGTMRFSSINWHMGAQQSRRDDMETLSYIFLYFLRGSLPWQSYRPKRSRNWKKEISRRFMDQKLNAVDSAFDSYPKEFLIYHKYCRSLGFKEAPDYEYVRKLFRDLFDREGFEYDYDFDWSSANRRKAEPAGWWSASYDSD
jgi:serine/threonine protein kinase